MPSSLPHPHALLNISRGHLVAQVHHKLGKLFHIDNVLGVFRVGIDDFCASVKTEPQSIPSVCWKPTAFDQNDHLNVNYDSVYINGSTMKNRTKNGNLVIDLDEALYSVRVSGTYLATCRGCSLWRVCLSAARSHSAGGASPVSDSLMPGTDKHTCKVRTCATTLSVCLSRISCVVDVCA